MKNLILLSLLTFTSLSLPLIVHGQTQLEVKKSNREIIINFKKVNNGLYRGARLESIEAINYLKNLGVKNIINLQGGDMDSDIGIIIPWVEPGETPEALEWEKQNALKLGLGVLNSPLNSFEVISNDEDRVIDQTLEFMHDPNNQPVFIHCEHGADRTGLLVALYRVKYEGMNVEAARDEWIKNGHNTLHRMFTGQLDDYFYEKVTEFTR